MKGLTVAFTRYVDTRWIDSEKSPNTYGGKELSIKDKSPSGFYPVIVVPVYLSGSKVIVIPVSQEEILLPMEELGETKPKIYGIRTDLSDNTRSIIESDWEIVINATDKRKAFHLKAGITGFESFYIDNDFDNLKKMSEHGWRANVGTKGSYDELFIPANEMKKVYDYLIKKK